MAEISSQAVKTFRDKTGLGMMECKKILAECGGDLNKALELAKLRGQDNANKLSVRQASEGIIECYVHFNKKVGVMVELNCNTDFVARNEDFQNLAHELAVHIAAMRPEVVNREQIDANLVKARREYLATEVPAGKPAEVVEKIVDGKMASWYAERVLLDQPWAKDASKTISQLVRDVTASTGENVTIARFVRYQVGETAEST